MDIRITATARHLTDPAHLVYMPGMEGELFEADVHTLACRQIADLQQELNSPSRDDPPTRSCT